MDEVAGKLSDSPEVAEVPIVFQALVERASGFTNRRLKGLYVISAPAHVLRHIIETDDNGLIRGADVAETLKELLTFGYTFAVTEPEVLWLAPIEWTGGGDE